MTSKPASEGVAFIADIAQRLVLTSQRQQQSILDAGALVADALRSKGIPYIYDSGHMVSHELIMRTGGLVAWTALELAPTRTPDNDWLSRRTQRSPDDTSARRVRWIDACVDAAGVAAGDVLILVSVSGTSATIVDLSDVARSRGAKVVAVTAVDFSAELAPQHASGRRLLDCADVVLDLGVPYGDAAFAIPGLDRPVGAVSGIVGATLVWAVSVEAVALLVADGLIPSVYTSINLPNGSEAVATVQARYAEEGL